MEKKPKYREMQGLKVVKWKKAKIQGLKVYLVQTYFKSTQKKYHNQKQWQTIKTKMKRETIAK